MIKHYFKIALRNFAKQKGLAFINVFGLSVGLACFTLFLLFAVNEFNFDQFHKNANNIYRVYLWSQAKGEEQAKGIVYHPMPLGAAMQQDLPGIENYVRLKEAGQETFIKTNNQVNREEVSFADPSFFSVFSFKLRSGDPAKALQDIHSVVLTDATAKKIFGNTDPVGKTIEIEWDNKFVPFIVTAITEDPPSNSSIQFKMLCNFNYLVTTPSGAKRATNWHQYSYQTFVQLKPGSTLPSDKNLFIAFRKKYYPDEEERS
ncbi:MAG TPA: ABC transporter permease, partial [Chitinophagaceae bacterium]|nr:ABC transporter permease [Chitinophagaceae bacterium]